MQLKRHVIIVGGGFGGLEAARALAAAPVQITLLDRRNHHLFQPLLYQVAMAGLSPSEIAVPIRAVLSGQDNARVLLGEVTSIDFAERQVRTSELQPLTYDYLVLATGAENTYFGHDEWRAFAPGLKDLDEALEIRRRVLVAFEAAERETDAALQRKHLTFVVIGGGPTGVELAGAIAELASSVLIRDFRAIRADAARVVLIEGGARLLSAFPEALSDKATASLRGMGVEVRLGQSVKAIDAGGVRCGEEFIEAATVLWAAGVRATGLCASLGLQVDRQGRAAVGSDCSVPGHPEVFAIGDAAAFVPAGQERALPGVSPVAMQQGRFVARQIRRELNGQAREVFRYQDKGSMATIGRSRAVALIGRVQLSGFIAWLAWLALHIAYLIGFRNRVLVFIDWAWAYCTYGRGSRLITSGASPTRPRQP